MARVAATQFELVDPRSGESVGTVACTPPEDVAALVGRARRAQLAWGASPLAERKRTVGRLRDALMARAADLAQVLQEEIGKPAGEAWTSEVVTAAELFEWWLDVIDDELEPLPVPLNPVNYPFKAVRLQPEPLGVIGLIMPWNYPVHLPLRTIVPALLAGNAVAFKPSEHATRCGQLLAEICASALPADLVVTVIGGPEQGRALVDARPDKVVFTGSVAGGRAVAERAASRLIPCSLELGSKDPAIVLHDADLERAAQGIAWGAFHNAGQDCASVERCYVDSRLFERFLERVVDVARGLRPGADVGPLITEEARARVHAQVVEAVAAGASVHCGGEPSGPGWRYPATVLTGVTDGMSVMRDETFGPVLPLIPFDSEDEAVGMANMSAYALCASVWSRDVPRAERLALQVRAGVSYVNNCCFTGPMGGAAWGGRGDSGYGVTGSRWGLDGLVHPRTVCVDRSRQKREMWWYPYTDSLTTMARGLVEVGRNGGAKLQGARMAVSGLVGRWK
jgi:acyl-CoA reductase-like NAD-dependent aldehyde dehydrogenase